MMNSQEKNDNLKIYKEKLKELDSVTDAHIKRILINQLRRERLGKTPGQWVGAVVGVVVGTIGLITGQIYLTGWAMLQATAAFATVGAAIGGLFDPPKVPDFGDATGYGGGSPTYGFGMLTNTFTNQLPVAVIYGNLKVAGNVIWQSDPGTTIQRIQVIGEGEVAGIYDVRVNNIPFGKTGAVEKETLINDPGGGQDLPTYYTQHDAISDFVLYGQNDSEINTDYWNFDYGANKVTFPTFNAWLSALLTGGGGDFKGSYTSMGISDCTYTAYTGTINQTVDARASDHVSGLKRCAYIAFTLTAGDKLKGGNPTTTCMVHGLKIRRWDDSNNIFKTHREYSHNPAECIRDFLTNDIYGAGVPESWIDDTSFGEVAEYCNVLVDDGAGGTEVRFRLDIAIDNTRPALDIINDMLGTFGGYITLTGETIKLHVEKAGESAAQAFTMDNILEGSFGYSQMAKDELPNRLLVQYVDPNQEWQRIEALAEDKVDQDEREALQLGQHIVEKKVSLLGITRFSQASRMAKRYLRLAKYSSIMCGIKVGIDALFCEVGDIVTISHDVTGWTSKPFRILAIQESEKDIMQLMLREYTSDVYNDTFGASVNKGDYGSVANPWEPVTDVTGLTLIEVDYVDTDGTHIAQISATWTAPTDKTREVLGYYVVEIKKGSGSYQQVGYGPENTFLITPLEVGETYYVRVKTASVEDIISDGTVSDPIIIVGDTTPPSNVTGFDVEQSGDLLIFTWDAISDADLARYVIKKGGVWSTATTIVEVVDTTEFISSVGEIGDITYMVKAVDTTGLESTIPGVDTISVVAPPDRNFIQEFDAWSVPHKYKLSDCRLIQRNDYDKTYTRNTIALETTTTWEEREADGQTWEYQESNDGLILDDTFLKSGYFEMVEPYDLETLFEFEIITDIDYKNASTNSGSVIVQISTSDDDITYTDFETVSAATTYSGRYVKFRFNLSTLNADFNTYFYSGIIYLEAPVVKSSWGRDIAVPNTGKTVTFGVDFTYAPRLVITISNGIVGVPVIDSKSTSNFVVHVEDLDGVTLDTAEIDYDAKGY